MSNQFLKLRRSAVPGKIPDTGSLDLGEIALNTYDGVAFMKKSVGGTESIVTIGNTTGSFTGSFSGEFTGSLLGTASWAYNAVTASTADDFYIRGNVTGSNALFSGTVTAQRLVVQTVSSSVIYSSGSNIFGDELTDTQQFTGSVTITGSLTVTSPSTFNGRVTANNLTGSLFGTSSWSSNAVTASYILQAVSASYALSASNAQTASFAQAGNGTFSGSFSGSFFGNGGGLTNISASSVVGLNLSLISSGSVTASTDPAYGFRVNANSQLSGSTQITGSLGVTGSVSISGSVGNVFSANIDTMTFSGSLYQTGSIILTGSLSVFGGGITGSLFGTSSWAVSASHAPTALTASYAISSSYSFNSTTASHALTASSADNFLVRQNITASNALINGTLTATTIVAQYITSSTEFITGSTKFGTQLTDTHQFTGSVTITGSLSLNNDPVVTQTPYNAFSSSIQLRATNLESTASILTSASASLAQDSGSNSIRITNLESTASVLTVASASFAIVSASYASASGSLSTRVTTLENASASFAQDSGSNSIRFTNLESTASVLTQASASFSSSISYLSSSFTAFSQSYNTGSFTGSFFGQAALTGSFTGSFSGILSGSFSGSIANIDGATNYIAKFDSPNSIDSSVIYQSASHIAINEVNFTPNDPEALYVFQTHPTSFNVVTGKGNTNNYLQLNIQNTNQGISASSDIVATANNGNEFSNYIDMGINSENFNTGFIGEANDAYVYSIANNLHIGNAATNGSHLGFFVGGDDVEANMKLQLNPNNRHIISGSLQLTGSLNVLEGITGSLFGTASWAISASHAPTALTSSYAISASYALSSSLAANSILFNGTSSGVFATTGSNIFKGSQTIHGNLFMSGSFPLIYNNDATNNMLFGMFDGSNIYGPYYQLFGNQYPNLTQRGGAEFVYDIRNNPDANFHISSFNGSNWYQKFLVNDNGAQVTGSLNVTGGITGSLYGTASWAENALTSSYILNAISSSYAATASSADNFFIRQNVTASNALITGTLTAQTIVAQYITSSTEFITGSTKFGTQLTDTHQFTGSVTITGSLSLNNDPVVTQTPYNNFSSSIQLRATNLESTASVLTSASASFAQQSGSNSIRLTNLESTASILTNASASFAVVSGSYSSASGSLSIRTTNLETTASILTAASASFAVVSGSYSAASSSLSIRTTNLESTASVLTTASASFAVVSGSYSSASGSLSIRTTNLESTASVLTSASASFASASGSFSTRVTTLENASASFASDSGSNSIRFTNLESTASVLTTASASFAIVSGSYSSASGSLSIRTTNLESTASVLTTASASFTVVSGSYSSASSSLSIRTTNLESTASVLTSASASFAVVSGSYSSASGSLSTRVTNLESTASVLTTASASFAVVSGSYSSASGSISTRLTTIETTYATTGSNTFNGSQTINGSLNTTGSITGSNVLVTGTLTAQTIIAQYITSSTEFITGSTKFGSQLTDTHQFTGSVTITGSLSLNNSPVITNSTFTPFSSSVSTRVTNLESTASVLTTASASFAIVSSSYASASGSLSTRVTNLESTASVLTTASASFAIVSSSFATTSASLSTRTTNLESTASVLTTASASFALVSSSYSAFSQSYNSGSFTGSFTGRLIGTASWASNAVTSSYVLQAVSASFATSASYAISSSYAYNADFLDGKDSSVFATTGSNVFIGTQTVTGSLFTSGSNTLVGNTQLSGSINISGSTTFRNSATTITGSLLVTGSTIQTGNNTLIGNTTLSGSIIISGSSGPGSTTASVQIYGDIRQAGYHRFDPVTTNINNSISASYIYVSGSTNDLYFTQNGSGYGNTTRLRWIEGNLYTGLLNGGLITTQSSTVYQVSSGSGIIVDLNASLTDNPYPTIQYLNWPNLTGSISAFTSSYQQLFVGIDNTNNLYAQGTPFYNGQVDTLIPVGDVFFQNGSTINGVKTAPSLAYGWKQRSNVFISAFGPLKLSGFTLAASGSSTGSLIIGSGTAFADGQNYTVDPDNPSYIIDSGTNVSKIFRYYQSGSTWVYQTNAGTGFATIDPANYSNNGTLTSVGAGNWSIQRVFWFPNSVTKAIVVYYGNNIYATEAEAIANLSIESFVEAPNTAANAVYVGSIVINGNGVFTNTNTFTILPGGLFRQVGGSGGGGSVVTQTLSGLSDVSISGPTNGQPLVYNSTSGKWENSSTLIANLTGNASTATSASFATTASYVLQAVSASYALSASSAVQANTASYVLQAVSASFSTTASFASQASTASYVLQAVSASFASNASTASYVLNAVSASYAATASSADNFLVRQNVTASNALITGTLTAQTIIAQYITSSTEFITGSTKFGTLLTDTHQFTGSVTVTGSLSVNNSPVITNATFTPVSSSVSTRLTNLESTASVLTTASASFAIVSASYSSASSSLSGRVTNLETTASVLTTASASFAIVSSSFATTSASLSTRTTNLETTASVLTVASASFALVSASYSALSGSFRSGSYTGSFTGTLIGTASWASNAVTASYVLNAISASFASTASSVNTLNQNVLITGSLTVGATTLGAAENTLTLGPRGVGEGGQLLLQAPGGTYTSASMLDNYQDRFRVLRGTNAGSDAEVAAFNMHTKQFQLPAYNSSTAFTGTAVANLSVDSSGNVITVPPGTITSASYALTASFAQTASYVANAQSASYVLNAISASYAATASSADSFLVRQNITASNALITGTLTAQTIIAQYITSSTEFITGSTKFGSQLTDTHQFTGSVTITGSLSLNNSPVVTNATFTPFSSSVSTRLVTLENASASFASDSGSNSGRLTRLESTASVLTTASASFAIVSSSYASASGSLSTRVTNLESTASVLTTASASFAQQSGSNSTRLNNLETTASVLTTASASFALVSASYSALSGSFRTGSYTGSFNGTLFGTSSWALNAVTASYVLQAVSASFATTASFAQTASFVPTSSLVGNFFVQGGNSFGTQALLGTNDTQNLAFETNGSVRMVVSGSNGFVGVGTTTPGYLLDVAGAVRFSNELYVNGVWSTTYGPRNSGDPIKFVNWSSGELVRINTTTGDVGIGTTTPSAKLDVNGNAVISGSLTIAPSSNIELQVASTGVKIGNISTDAHTVTGSFNISGSSTIVGPLTATNITGSLFGTASWAVNATTASFVLNAVSASFAATASSADNFLIRQNATASNLLVNNTITAQTLVVQTVTSSIVYSSGSNIFGNLPSNVQQFTGSLRVTGSGNHWVMGGNVGINTSSPAYRLDVSGSVAIPNGEFYYARRNTSNAAIGVLGFAAGSNALTVKGGASGGSTAIQFEDTAGVVGVFYNANLGINNTIPVYRLDVGGSGNFTANLTATGSIRFPSLANTNQVNVVSYDTTTGQLFYQTTSSLNVTSASYAATSSYATNFTIQNQLIFDQTLTDYSSVASSVAGSNNLFTQATGSYTSAFFKYTVSNSTNARTGEVLAVWNGASVQFTDNSTLDIGTTTPVTCSVSLVGSDVLFNVQTNTSGWRIKSIGTFM